MTHVLDHLIDEHRKVEGLLHQLKQSETGSERAALFGELTESLGTHMAVEERFVYPVMAEHLGSDIATDAKDEHQLARDSMAEARRRMADGAFEAAIEILESGISHHVEEEERDQFPKLRVQASAELDRMDPAVLEQQVKGTTPAPDVDGMTRDELYQAAKEADIAGRSKMTKRELAEAVGGRGTS